MTGDPVSGDTSERRTVVLLCGHTAMADDRDGNPCCPICDPRDPASSTVDQAPPTLDGREAVCDYCRRRVVSDWGLPFFGHCPQDEVDSWYCGCRGWD